MQRKNRNLFTELKLVIAGSESAESRKQFSLIKRGFLTASRLPWLVHNRSGNNMHFKFTAKQISVQSNFVNLKPRPADSRPSVITIVAPIALETMAEWLAPLPLCHLRDWWTDARADRQTNWTTLETIATNASPSSIIHIITANYFKCL